MNPQISHELHQALARQPGHPLKVEDPVTHTEYVLVQLEVFERLQRALDYDDSDPNPRDFYPAFAEAVGDDLDSPDTESLEVSPSPEKV